MKINKLFIGLVLSCIILLSSTQTTSPSQCCGYNTMRVQGTGETRVKPDIAILYASLTQEGKTAT